MPNKDKRGVLRGSCLCGRCGEYVSQAEGHVCGYCGCHPVKHAHLERPEQDPIYIHTDSAKCTGPEDARRRSYEQEDNDLEDLPEIKLVPRNRSHQKFHVNSIDVNVNGHLQSTDTQRTGDRAFRDDLGDSAKTAPKESKYKIPFDFRRETALNPEKVTYEKTIKTHSSGGNGHGKKSRSPRTAPDLIKKKSRISAVPPCELLHNKHLPYDRLPQSSTIRGVYKIAYDKKTIYVGRGQNLRAQIKRQFSGNPWQEISRFISNLSEEQRRKRLTVFWLDSDIYKHNCGGKSYYRCISDIQGEKPKYSYFTGYTEATGSPVFCKRSSAAVGSTEFASLSVGYLIPDNQCISVNNEQHNSRSSDKERVIDSSSMEEAKGCKIFTSQFKKRNPHLQRPESETRIKNTVGTGAKTDVFKESEKVSELKNHVETYRPGEFLQCKPRVWKQRNVKRVSQETVTSRSAISLPADDTPIPRSVVSTGHAHQGIRNNEQLPSISPPTVDLEDITKNDFKKNEEYLIPVLLGRQVCKPVRASATHLKGQITNLENNSRIYAGQKSNMSNISNSSADFRTFRDRDWSDFTQKSDTLSVVQTISTTVLSTKSSREAGGAEIRQTVRQTTRYRNIKISPETHRVRRQENSAPRIDRHKHIHTNSSTPKLCDFISHADMSSECNSKIAKGEKVKSRFNPDKDREHATERHTKDRIMSSYPDKEPDKTRCRDSEKYRLDTSHRESPESDIVSSPGYFVPDKDSPEPYSKGSDSEDSVKLIMDIPSLPSSPGSY